jgi:cytochrome c oxidase subunit 2
MNRSSVTFALIFLALLVAACAGENTQTQDIAAIGDPANGEALFNSGGDSGIPCLTCHTLDGTPLVGPSLNGIGERAATRIEGVSAEDYLRQSIVSPSAYIVEGYSDSMNKTYPEFLSEQEIDDLVAFLLGQ